MKTAITVSQTSPAGGVIFGHFRSFFRRDLATPLGMLLFQL